MCSGRRQSITNPSLSQEPQFKTSKTGLILPTDIQVLADQERRSVSTKAGGTAFNLVK